MQLDFMTLLCFGAASLAAVLLFRHFQGGSVGEEDGSKVGQEEDVVEALKSMRKD